MQALLSIHDVMPHTLERVERILDWLKERGVPPVTLLVVPGRPWEAAQIDRLRELAETGYELAAHGWLHETLPRRLYHRLHAALISRNVAEHLDLDPKGILELMQRSRNWFGDNNLPQPNFYVPPAWALGPVSKSELAQAPYRLVETTRGVLHLGRVRYPYQTDTANERRVKDNAPYHENKEIDGSAAASPQRMTNDGSCGALRNGGVSFQKLPLTGYEADTPFREFFLRRWNAAQARAARRKNLPLRISIHPDDLELRVADQMEEQILSIETFKPYLDRGHD